MRHATLAPRLSTTSLGIATAWAVAMRWESPGIRYVELFVPHRPVVASATARAVSVAIGCAWTQATQAVNLIRATGPCQHGAEVSVTITPQASGSRVVVQSEGLETQQRLDDGRLLVEAWATAYVEQASPP
jgi:hypothetical protein